MKFPEKPQFLSFSQWKNKFKEPGSGFQKNKITSINELKYYVKLRTKPKFPDEVVTQKLKLACIYALFAAVIFHKIIFQKITLTKPDSDIEAGLDFAKNNAKLITFENFKLTKVVDFNQEDFDQIMEERKKNKPKP